MAPGVQRACSSLRCSVDVAQADIELRKAGPRNLCQLTPTADGRSLRARSVLARG
jgi:hypothetical protein